MTCAKCNEPLEPGAVFCEACGAPVSGVTPTDPVGAAVAASEEASPLDLGSSPISASTKLNPGTPASVEGARPCLSCGGEVGPDGYCGQCGTKQASERDHFRETPSSWVAGVCDRGIRHSRNEDAMALLASTTPGERAVLVVLDGVSNTDDSDRASLAGARAARAVLTTPLPQGMGTDDSRRAAVTKVFADAVVAANDAVVAVTPEGSTAPPSTTFVCAVVEDGLITFSNIGDSRSYWLPDGQPGVQLSVDDSVARQMMDAGATRAQAESSAQAHAITRWLGRDAPDLTPRLGELRPIEPGWLLVCSDGLWNYASDPEALAAQVAAAGTSDPTALALALVGFANAAGGQDNITATLARIEPPAPPPAASEPDEPDETPAPLPSPFAPPLAAPEGDPHG